MLTNQKSSEAKSNEDRNVKRTASLASALVVGSLFFLSVLVAAVIVNAEECLPEEAGLTRETSCGVGACASTGIETCTATTEGPINNYPIFGNPDGLLYSWIGDTCTPGTPGEEVCDGVDNDCDGVLPENEIDSDNDHVIDCLDLCSNDPHKTDPGACGCGVPDVDTDSDRVLDCNDSCPESLVQWSSDPSTDRDRDGCRDSDEDNDDDNDRLYDASETGTGIYAGQSDTGTDSLNHDSDFDGAMDGDEVDYGFSPVDPRYLVEAGGFHTCAFADSRRRIQDTKPTTKFFQDGPVGRMTALSCWGSYFDTPVNEYVTPAWVNVKQMSAGVNHNCAVSERPSRKTEQQEFGTIVQCWGDNRYGQTDVPDNPALINPRQVSAGEYHSCALDNNGVTCWGTYTNSNFPIPTLEKPRQIASGWDHICVLDGTSKGVTCWGNSADRRTQVPAGLSNPRQITAGGSHTCVLDDNGVQCWGGNFDNPDDNSPYSTPKLINPRLVTAGFDHTCALDDEGIQCWGDKTFGQTAVPEEMIEPHSVTAGGDHTCAMGKDKYGWNFVTCWGDSTWNATLIPHGMTVTDFDRDNVQDTEDENWLDNTVCMDGDQDTCDDCSSGIYNPYADGTDIDYDGLCDAGDPDDDNDQIPDEEDGCPKDYNKSEPGICGCGWADTDTDKDGTADCKDECVADPLKIVPGVCGCGVSDMDSDHDGTADCKDGCAGDPAKTDPGVCGCGIADIDADEDGYFSCDNDCNDENSGINPGVEETCNGIDDDCDESIDEGFDADSDAVTDCLDNCASTANADQTDMDEDGIGDLCDDDVDGDGRTNDEEGYNGSDGGSADSNENGIPDYQDPLTASFEADDGTGDMILTIPDGQLGDCSTIDEEAELDTSDMPNNLNFGLGFINFTITGLTPYSSIDIKLISPVDLPSDAQYWKYDSNGYYQVDNAIVNGREITFTLTDEDGDGTIIDPGAIGTPVAAPVGGGGGGGCSIKRGTPSQGMDAGIVLILLMPVLMRLLRRTWTE